MTPTEFKATASGEAPPAGLTAALAALWWSAKGDWPRAHETAARDEDDRDAAWVHAYLHREEGDDGNARYWYARAGKPVFAGPLAAEWDAIAQALLA